MDKASPTITSKELRPLVEALADNANVSGCISLLARTDNTIPLDSPVCRNELLRIYRRRESRADRDGLVVPGGKSLVQELSTSTAEWIFVVTLSDEEWSGAVFLEDSTNIQCLGCISGRSVQNPKS